MAQRPYIPDQPLTSALRALQDYVAAAFDPDIVEVQLGFPDLTEITRETPLPKTIVHIDLDADVTALVGMGAPSRDVYVAGIGGLPSTVVSSVADGIHSYNLDIGIWASEESGGGTSRMEVHEALSRLFVGPVADVELAEATNGIHIVLPGLSGGRYVLDEFNDVPVWRAMDLALIVRVFSRRTPPADTAIDTVEVELDTFVTP